MNQKWEEIIVLAGEGGSITLLGSKTSDDSWVFMKETNESALADFLVDEDLSALVHQKSKVVSDWEQAINLLGRSWMNLYPRYVHPEFRKPFWKIVASTNENYHLLERWERHCFL
ncbi:hypothetical protein [Paenibacillus vini]|uniref:Uncharacterized protein n=1 Tax=Paenibacillus vini TaxID=1476024 RepID=A0ABQ4MAC9_9BACL|nr:hypothetical protein [Paenibacillus vini]GIP52929.1 hypothetical protein J42TS3_19640 [Paenibacillus vini]